MHLNGFFFEKFHFLKTVEAKVIILTWYVEPNETMAINHIGVPSTRQNIVSSETTRPFELKFHMKTPYDRLAKIYTKCTGHMTKMATTPIYGKNPLYVFFSGTKRPMALRLGM